MVDAPASDGTMIDDSAARGTILSENRISETQPVQVSGVPTIPPADPASAPGQPDQSGQSGKSDKGIVAVIITAVVVIALIIGGTIAYLHVKSVNDAKRTEQMQTSSKVEKPKKNASKAGGQSSQDKKDADKSTEGAESDKSRNKTKQTSRTLNKSEMDAIVDGFSTAEVGVSVMTEDGLRSYSSRNASLSYVAAGLYLPAWLDYRNTHGQKPDGYDDSLTGMNNNTANELIDAVGGESSLNDWLSDNKYRRTRFEREYGDVRASQSGYENYSSPDDAARMLSEMAKTGDDGLMNYDIASEGVTIPAGATVHAHRGQGIKDSYNYFVVISNGKQKVAVAVMTQNQGKDSSAQLTSSVLDKVWNTMLKN